MTPFPALRKCARLLFLGAAVLLWQLWSAQQTLAQQTLAQQTLAQQATAQQPVLQNPIAGKPLAEQLDACSACHGRDGNSEQSEIPSLAGQPELYIVNQLILFREGLRKSEPMSPFAAGLDDREIIALAAQLAKLAPKSDAKPADAGLNERAAVVSAERRCGVCHLKDYRGREQIPRIAGQREDYLVKSLKSYRDNQRTGADTNMTAALYGISDADIGALAHYLARKP